MYWPTDRHKTPDVLDFFVTKSVCEHNTHIESSLDESSEHTPVTLTLCTVALPSDTQNNYLHNAKTDWESFMKYLEANNNLKLSLKTPEQVDDACLYLTNLLQVAAWTSTSKVKKSHRSVQISVNIREKTADKHHLRRIW